MHYPLLVRLVVNQTNPIAIGVMTFVTTVAMILAQPGAAIA